MKRPADEHSCGARVRVQGWIADSPGASLALQASQAALPADYGEDQRFIWKTSASFRAFARLRAVVDAEVLGETVRFLPARGDLERAVRERPP